MSLAGRLKSLKAFEAEKNPIPERKSTPQHEGSPGIDWTQRSPMVWEKITARHFPSTGFPESRWLSPRDITRKDFLFYDTETTGLSGGTGILPFLVGWGEFCGDQLMVHQLFLADYPGEPEFLTELKKTFSPERLNVSYNGRTFDSHLLRNRFLMNRMTYDHGRELDLLYTARRLWKGILPACNLGQIETSVLNKKRDLDIPGEEIPQVWFDFLKEGPSEKLQRVFSHHLEDIVSLAELYLLLEELPPRALVGQSEAFPYNRLKLAVSLMERKDSRGRELLEKLAAERDSGAMKTLGLILKREGRWKEAATLWDELNRHGTNLFAAEEQAKYLEHRCRNYPEALTIVENCLKKGLPLTREQREALTHRRLRLERKCFRE